MTSVDRTLIVGGGIAGLTLAAALHQKGFEAEIIERSTCWNAIGAGISVQANAMRVLRALGMDAGGVRWTRSDRVAKWPHGQVKIPLAKHTRHPTLREVFERTVFPRTALGRFTNVIVRGERRWSCRAQRFFLRAFGGSRVT